MATVRRTTPARSKTAITKTITELSESIATLDTTLEEMNAKQTEFLQTSYISQKVHHQAFGEGIIIEQKEDIIRVSFTEQGLTKAFVIHRKFTNRPVFENDDEVISAFSDFADRRLAINHLKQERIRLEKQRAERIQE